MKDVQKIKVVCQECGKEEFVIPARAKKYLTCSKECLGKFNSKRYSKKVDKTCAYCGTIFLVKKSSFDRRKTCSDQCHVALMPISRLGKNNPNYKGKTVDSDGYPKSNYGHKVHIKICEEYLNVKKLPKGFHVHHRDQDKTNNTLSNLVLMEMGEHVWLHKHYGNAVLKALSLNKITVEELQSWSPDPDKAKRLLTTTIIDQSAVLKSGELLETPNIELDENN